MKNSNIQSYHNTPRINIVFTMAIQPKALKTLRTDTGLCNLNLLNDKDSQFIARVYYSQLYSQRKNEKMEAYIVPWLKVLFFPISKFEKSP